MPSTKVEPSAAAEQIAHGTWCIPVPMPGHSFGEVNVYVLETEDGLVLIDTPWGTPEAVAHLEAGIAHTGHAVADVRLVLLTHYHEDHSGAAGSFSVHHGAEVVMHAADAACYERRFGGSAAFAEAIDEWADVTGADDAARRSYHDQFRELSGYAIAVDVGRPVLGGETLVHGGREIRVVHTPGHTPGSTSYLDVSTGFVFSGDHVFDRRRSNAVSRPYNVDRPIATYWESCRLLETLSPVRVYPGHGGPILDLDARFRYLEDVCRRKLAEVVALAETRTAWAVAQRVKRRSPWGQLDANAKLAATGEALAYLKEAHDAGAVRRIAGVPARWEAVQGDTRGNEHQ
ncbi:MBL fold metallo-hydrolase [Microbacterium pseudoresistens]|uniref:Glyoxylase-like metal-dependent hydrolase (Beta-lactamase superfamily II) n=1 Tax=Microbacterium pseudoresistens TaxID=640634 RepID=A0A7Y9EUU3_9MICO|nr:glyoxylase-like metal-dependent hydrolase (beta-lactamase superfamily II) [Microbacterium pseudoresistens]